MREYRSGSSRSYDRARASGTPGSSHQPAKRPDDAEVVQGRLAAAAEGLAAIAGAYVPKLEAAANAADERPARARRAEYDDARKLADGQLETAAKERTAAVAHAERHEVDASEMLATFDDAVRTAREVLATAPPPPKPFETVPLEEAIAAEVAKSPADSEVRVERQSSLRRLFEQLDPNGARIMRARLRNPDSEDGLALRFRDSFAGPSKDELFRILDGAPRRAALAAAFGPAPGTIDTPTPHAESQPAIHEGSPPPAAGIDTRAATDEPSGRAPATIDAPPSYDERSATIQEDAPAVADITGLDESAQASTPGTVASQPHQAAHGFASVKAPTVAASAMPDAVEAALRAELSERISGDDTRAQVARRRRLEGFCRSIASPHREALAARLAHPSKGDSLAAYVRGELHDATVTALIRALNGQPEAIAGATSPVARAVLDVFPGTDVTLDRSFGPTAHVRVTPRAVESPGVDAAPITLRWARRLIADPAAPPSDDRALEPERDSGNWLGALTEGDPFVFKVREPGFHHVRCDVAEGGIVIAVLETEINVQETARSDAAAYRTNKSPDDPHTRWDDEGVARKRGEDLVAAMTVPGENLATAHSAKQAQLATDSTLDPEQRAALADEVSVIEFAAAQRQAPLWAPPPTGETITLGEWVLSEDPAYLRSLVEGIYARSDAKGVEAAIEGIEDDLRAIGQDVDPGDADDPLAHLPTRIIMGMRSQWATLRGEIEQFTDEFHTRARYALFNRLLESKHVVASELERYTGIWVPDVLRPYEADRTDPHHDPAIEMPKLMREAGELTTSQRQLDDVRARYAHAANAQAAIDDKRVLDDPLPALLDPDIAAVAEDVKGDPEGLQELISTLQRMIGAAEQEHSQRVLLATAQYPMLANYKVDVGANVEVDVDGLSRITGGNTEAEIVAKARKTLANMDRTHTAVNSGELNVWKQSRVIDLARADMLIAPGSVRDRAIQNQMAAAQGGDWKDWALAALTVALALAAAIPTGGSSLAAGIVAGAEILTLAADIYVALDALEEYQIDKAAAGTDFDKARAIAASEPSLLWVAVDLIAVGLSVKSMISTFRDIRRAWKSARAGGSIDEAVAVVHAEHHAGRLSAEAAERLEREMVGGGADAGEGLTARAGDDLVEDADDAIGAARMAPERRQPPIDPEHADDVAVLSGPRRVDDRRPRVRTADLGLYEKKLGAIVEPNAGLEDGVRVHFTEIDGQIVVTRIEMGPLALVDDLLAHQRTIARLTRYNGVVGGLRRLWDELVSLVGGNVKVNPFLGFPGPGSRAFESFEEMRKLDEMLRVRRAAWSPDALDADIIDDEIRHLQGELAHHSEVVRNSRETLQYVPGQGFIERPPVGQRTIDATTAGWKLPDQHPEHYYYRLSDTSPGAYELAIKPSAPKNLDLPSLHAEFQVVDGVPTPTGNIVPGSERRRAAQLITELDSPDDVLRHLQQMPSVPEYLEMLTKTGDRVAGAKPLATADEIAQAIADIRAARGSVTDDVLRHELKKKFRKRVEDFITDATLDNQASHRRMMQTLDGLAVADRGNICEVWYQTRFAKQSDRHVPIDVTRVDNAAGEEWLEPRQIDLFDGKTATEVKSGAGPIDKDQFEAYLQMAEGKQRAAFDGKAHKVEAIKYVFADPRGARQNLPSMAAILRKRDVQVTIEVFDETGQLLTLRSADDIDAFLRGDPL